jgi:hypothetical protein
MAKSESENERPRGYVVISKTLVGKDYRDCRVIPHGDPYPAVYRQVFGPASQKECKQWAARNCKNGQK